jgi:hypothetical protein
MAKRKEKEMLQREEDNLFHQLWLRDHGARVARENAER